MGDADTASQGVVLLVRLEVALMAASNGVNRRGESSYEEVQNYIGLVILEVQNIVKILYFENLPKCLTP
ncbi:MAG: hypothetical protein Q4G70_02175 [Pseudomonadota bacterium]|nr:hypothetical protein [Pseudomonadota bacterium]